jgi:DNA repair photolyase
MRQRKNNDRVVHGTGEWADATHNIHTGCEHDCGYCYAKAMAVRFKRPTPAEWSDPRPRTQEAIDAIPDGSGGRIMLPSTHDITLENLDACVLVLKSILKPGNEVLIVSKPHLVCVERLCAELAEYRDQIAFQVTIGSADDTVLTLWEPGAPPFAERLASLKYAYDKGFETSVSCEPMLDANIAAVVEAVAPYVTDAIWLGRANRLRHALALTYPGDEEMRSHADALTATRDDDAAGSQQLHRTPRGARPTRKVNYYA